MLSRLAIKAGIASDRDDLSRDSDADFAEDGRHPNADRPSQSDLPDRVVDHDRCPPRNGFDLGSRLNPIAIPILPPSARECCIKGNRIGIKSIDAKKLNSRAVQLPKGARWQDRASFGRLRGAVAP